MRSKPKGAKYRNLHARGGVIYYERVLGSKRIKLSTKTCDWDTAASFRELYEAKKGIGTVAFYSGELPTFSEFAIRYLDEDTAHLAKTTRSDRSSYLRAKGPLLGFFGGLRLDDISPTLLREWWNQEITAAGRSTRTGRAYLDVLSSVLIYAIEMTALETSPVPTFRETLRRRNRTQRGRSESETGKHVRPIELPDEIARLSEAALAEGPTPYLMVILLLDAGLRLGEALGLRWGKVVWGVDENDPGRSLRIDEARPRGGDPGPTKTGRARNVALSRRLRRLLLSAYEDRFRPGPQALVLEGVEPNNFRNREWRRILKRARLDYRPLKDLRDTFSSQLLTAGVQLGYVSAQLGHSDAAITAQHYAKWANGDVYREPMRLELGEVPADFLARLDSHQSPTTPEISDEALRENRLRYSGLLVGAAGFEPATFSSQS